MGFIHISPLDILDILLVAVLIYQLYRLIRGTNALSIFIGILMVYLLWIVVRLLNMELLSLILGQVMGVGVIALIVVFQQEIRRFLIVMGNRYSARRIPVLGKLFKVKSPKYAENQTIESIVKAASNMSSSKTGALIVIERAFPLIQYIESGDAIGGEVSHRLIENIFFKNAPLHDGALIIARNKVAAARCLLPSSENPGIPPEFGMRHRAAVGVSEASDCVVAVVSEETGRITFVENGMLSQPLSPSALRSVLEKALTTPEGQ